MKTEQATPAPRPIAVFDFDGTMISGDSIVPFVWQAVKEGYLSPFQLPAIAVTTRRALKGRITAEAGKSRALRFLGAMPQEVRTAFCKRFCERRLMPRIYTQAMERLRAHQAQGNTVVLLSASPHIYLQHLQALLRVDAVLATPTDESGVVTNNNRGEEKVRRLKAWAEKHPYDIDWQASYAYGDSAHDLPVMRLCGHPIAVNPRPAMTAAAPELSAETWR